MTACSPTSGEATLLLLVLLALVICDGTGSTLSLLVDLGHESPTRLAGLSAVGSGVVAAVADSISGDVSAVYFDSSGVYQSSLSFSGVTSPTSQQPTR